VTSNNWQRAKDIFNSALELDVIKRQEYLSATCAGNVELRQKVDDLLSSYDSDFMEKPDIVASDDSKDGRLTAGSELGRYEIVRLLGAGGMGEVYLAKDSSLGRKVAIKILNQKYERHESNIERFVREAKAASALNHPNILTIHEIGETNDSHFIVSEFVDGRTLCELLNKKGDLDLAEVLEIAIQTASALSAAHTARIIHRDIKPENIVVRDDGYVKVLDFGLAKLLPERLSFIDSEANTVKQNQTAEGLILGTVNYMSPEQAMGEAVDPRTDIFSLGIVMYEMITGRTPFAAGSTSETLANLINKEPPPLSRFSPVVSDDLQRIVSKMLRKAPDERYQTMKGLRADLKDLSGQAASRLSRDQTSATEHQNATALLTRTTGDVPQTTVETSKTTPWYRRPVFLAPTAVLLLALLAAGWYWRSTTTALGSRAINSIAVLPFVNTNSDADTEFLSDGITDNIIDRLSQLPNLKVTSHTAVFHYKGQESDPKTIAKELGVEAVLTGRVAKRGDALSISLELVDASDNSHLWGGQYDRKLSDLLALQREIPVDVSDQLRLRLSGESKERLTRASTNNDEAYQLYLRGRYSWEKWTQDGSKQAVEFYERAIDRDPGYALAYAGLADAYIFGAGTGMPQKEAHRLAREAATKALSIDPQLGEAHAALAEVLLYDEWDFSGAERELKRAIELNPNYAEGHHEYSHLLLLLGRPDESFVESMKLLELDPVSETAIGHLGWHYLYARQYDEAIQQYRKDLQLYPDVDIANYFQFGNAYYQKGMYDEAVAEYLQGFAGAGLQPEKIAEFKEAFARGGIKGFYRHWLDQLESKPLREQNYVLIGELYARLDEKDQAFEWLEKAYAQHSDGIVRLKEEVGFDNLRSDPRYADLLRRIGLPQ